MNCRYVQDHLTDLLAGELAPDRQQRIEQHLAACPACAAAYRSAREARNAVTPRTPLKVPDTLRDRILETARRTEAARGDGTVAAPAPGRGRRRQWLGLAAGTLSAAAVLAGALLAGLNTPARAARSCFRQATVSMGTAHALRMELRIRTSPDENFAYTDPLLDFVPVTITAVYTPTLRWRAEKPDRKAFSDGTQIYQWLSTGDGYIQYPDADVLDQLRLLLDPRTLLLHEEQLARKTEGATYRVERGAEEVVVTVTCPALGDYRESDYMLDTSITASNTRREYRFDADDGRLLGARIWVVAEQGERQILDLVKIIADPPINLGELTQRPEGISWVDLRKAPAGSRLAGIDVAQAGKLILNALTAWDEALLDEALLFYGPNGREALRAQYGGAVPTAISDPVQSGEYPGRFIPCRLLLRDGTTEKVMLALRNDTANGAWVVDGGL